MLGFFFIISDSSSIASNASLKENQDWPIFFFKKEGELTTAVTTTKKITTKNVRNFYKSCKKQDVDVLFQM